MNIELIFKMLTPQQVVALLSENKVIDPSGADSIAKVENKGGGTYAYLVRIGPGVYRRYLIQIQPGKIDLIGSYLWQGDVA